MSYPDDQTILKCVLQLDKKWRENIYIWMRIMMEFFIQKTTSELLSKQHSSQATIIKAFLQIQRRRSVYESFLKNKIADLFGKAQFPQSFWRIANLLKKKACNFIKKGFRHWCFPMNSGEHIRGSCFCKVNCFMLLVGFLCN